MYANPRTASLLLHLGVLALKYMLNNRKLREKVLPNFEGASLGTRC